MAPQVALLVIAYGHPEELAQALAGLPGAPGIVVDNSSSPEVRAVTAAAGVDYLDPGANLGFAAGVNRGLARFRDDPPTYVLLLNPDAHLTPDALALLVDALEADPQLAAVGPTLRSPSGRTEPTVWPVPTPRGTLAGAFGRYRAGEVFLNGAVLVLRWAALDEVGPFDERFFLYGEECDWQVRARRAGWQLHHVTAAGALHLGGGTSSDPRQRLRYFHASGLTFALKWHGRRGALVFLLGGLLAALRRCVTTDPVVRREQWFVARLTVRGAATALGHRSPATR